MDKEKLEEIKLYKKIFEGGFIPKGKKNARKRKKVEKGV